MPDRIEEILKEIHVLFAKGERYQDSPDRVIVSKREMFELLEELNEELYAVMDRYEATARSREQARLEQDRQAAEIVAQAKRDSDDVHAATLMYTDKMLDELNARIDQTRLSVKHELLEMLAEIETQQENLEHNKESVRNELSELHDNETYLKLLDKLHKDEENKRRFGLKDEDEDDVPEPETQKASVVIRVDKPGENSGVTFSTRKSHKNKKSGNKAAAPADDEQITLTGPEGADSEAPVPSGTVFTSSDFDLDGEYEQWKAEQEGEGQKAPEAEAPKGLRGLFGHKKNS